MLVLVTLLAAFAHGFQNAPPPTSYEDPVASVSLNSSWLFPLRLQAAVLEAKNFFCHFSDATLTINLQTTSNDGIEYQPLWWPKHHPPALDPNSTLRLQPDGNLVLRYANGTLAWQTNTAGRGVDRLELLEIGNLVLLTSSQSVVWQSFDSPTNLLLPNQSLVVGGRLESKLSDKNFTVPGNFYLEVGASSVVLYARADDSSVQSYGSWCNEEGNNISSIQVHPSRLVCYAQNSSELSSAQIVLNDNYTSTGPTMLELTSDGDLHLRAVSMLSGSSFISNGSACGEGPGACGFYGLCEDTRGCTCLSESFIFKDHNQGCIPDTPPACNGDNELMAFLGVTNSPAHFNLPEAPVTTLEECKTSCMNSCTCQGLVFYHATSQCIQQAAIYTSFTLSATSSTTLVKAGRKQPLHKGPVQPLGRDVKGRSRTWILLAVTGASILLAIALAVRPVYQLLKSKPEIQESIPYVVPNLPQFFKYGELVKVTDNFSTQLGKGGFGVVSRGVLSDGTNIAVKHLTSAREGLKQFESEVRTIGSIHHRNLVKLLGYSVRDQDYYLIYEIQQNLSLDRWLFTEGGTVLDWQKRFQIALDIASGLQYLHDGCQERILHLDIKPQNVLLDGDFRAKICDFGFSRLVTRGDSSIQMTLLRGTPGYMAAEWLRGKVTDKTDVYSFGILLLEIVTGRKAAPMLPTGESTLSLVRTKSLEDAETLIQKVDPNLLTATGLLDMDQLKLVTSVGLLCIQDEPDARPRMEKALKMLEGT